MGVDLVLCGHDHQEAVHFVEHTARAPCLDGGHGVEPVARRASLVGEHDHVPPDAIEVVTLIWSSADSALADGPARRFAR